VGNIYEAKSKAIPLQAWGGPEGSRRLRLPDLMRQKIINSKCEKMEVNNTCLL
jgi:hypothetical protein